MCTYILETTCIDGLGGCVCIPIILLCKLVHNVAFVCTLIVQPCGDILKSVVQCLDTGISSDR